MAGSSPGQPPGFLLPSTGSAVDDDLEPLHAGEGLSDGDVEDGMDEQGRAQAAAAEKSLRLRMADGRLVDELALAGFTGPMQKEFEEALVQYGVSVLSAWLRTGHINVLLRAKGLSTQFGDLERARAARDKHLIDDLAAITVVRALRTFVDKALIAGRWDRERGARLTTYFMGTCLFAFASELEISRTEHRHQAGDVFEGAAGFETSVSPAAEDPAHVSATHEELRQVWGDLNEREREVAALMSQGYEYDEIAETLDLSSARAVEGIVRRWRIRLGIITPGQPTTIKKTGRKAAGTKKTASADGTGASIPRRAGRAGPGAVDLQDHQREESPR